MLDIDELITAQRGTSHVSDQTPAETFLSDDFSQRQNNEAPRAEDVTNERDGNQKTINIKETITLPVRKAIRFHNTCHMSISIHHPRPTSRK